MGIRHLRQDQKAKEKAIAILLDRGWCIQSEDGSVSLSSPIGINKALEVVQELTGHIDGE
jgi:hypothetical protein